MQIPKATPINDLLARLIFLILPTALVAYFLIVRAQAYFGIIGDPGSGFRQFFPSEVGASLQLTLFALIGMAASAVFYSLRFRFLPTFALLVIGLYSIYKGIDAMATGEFDYFFISIQFLVFTTLFVTGWLVGWGFVRLRYWSIFVASVLLVACFYVIAKGKLDTSEQLLAAFAPAALYAVYLLFTAEQINNYKDKQQKFWWYLTRRMIAFAVLTLLILGSVVWFMRGNIEETVANYGGGGKGGKNSMLKENKDKTFDLQDYTRLRGSLGRDNELLFCAHIDNYFPGTEIPNPLYLTAFYYTKFDTLTETFERDQKIPFNDLFEPKPASLPLFFMKQDSTVIRNALGPKLRRTVSIEVYSKNLSPETYLAPSTGYFVQPIAIEKDFRGEFKSAFRAKSYVSELNSAYFIYNAQKNKELAQFQEQRFNVLRKVTDYTDLDARFLAYYTYMPSDAKFQRIANLAKDVTAKAASPVDKVLAIRDYFTSSDENGEPLFKYTDNPGVPDIPDASKLQYFLFENRKGYCAYYAGATLFMLRALGIPSRIAVGFLTVDRSDKNKGWYWYYADQAHAWVQVYFPGYGWLDFDTTVGNEEAERSPKPDGTPPMQPPRAWLAAEGVVQDVDTLRKIMKLAVRTLMFHDKELNVEDSLGLTLDVKIAAIKRDSADVPLSSVKPGDSATAVSYAEAFKKLSPLEGASANTVARTFPLPSPTDEVYLKRIPAKDSTDRAQQVADAKKPNYKHLFWQLGIGLLAILALWAASPMLMLQILFLRYRSSKNASRLFAAYQTASFYLHQLGIYRGNKTPMQYAREDVDPQFGSHFATFMNHYLAYKYGGQRAMTAEQQRAEAFLPAFMKQVRTRIKWRRRLVAFLKPARMLQFFGKSDFS